MKGPLYLKSLVAGLTVAAILSVLSFLAMSRVADQGASQHRTEFLSFLAESVQGKVHALSIEQIRALPNTEIFDPGPPPFARRDDHRDDHRDGQKNQERRFGGPGGPPPPGLGGRGPRLELWLVTEDGLSIAARAPNNDYDWAHLEKPLATGELRATEDFFRIRPGYYVMKLAHDPALYLVMRESRRPFAGPLLATQALLTFATVLAALIFSLSFTFFYLRRKSIEARVVLLRLERGDLKARFEIAKFDEFGSLLLDFNRMAEEIERLVSRLFAAESSRKNLLQELGHDLRTPLTSLTTSFETFRSHFAQMDEGQRTEIGDMIGAEIEYITELIEKLMQIASLDDPHYRGSQDEVDLNELLATELRARQLSARAKLDWFFESLDKPAFLIGDGHLVLRLFRNAFDNAERFAKSEVRVSIKQVNERTMEVRVSDDGPGLSEKELESFGKRREQRALRESGRLNFSLGLGSVIMKTIAELHEGRVEIRNRHGGGAEVIVTLPINLKA